MNNNVTQVVTDFLSDPKLNGNRVIINVHGNSYPLIQYVIDKYNRYKSQDSVFKNIIQGYDEWLLLVLISSCIIGDTKTVINTQYTQIEIKSTIDKRAIKALEVLAYRKDNEYDDPSDAEGYLCLFVSGIIKLLYSGEFSAEIDSSSDKKGLILASLAKAIAANLSEYQLGDGIEQVLKSPEFLAAAAGHIMQESKGMAARIEGDYGDVPLKDLPSLQLLISKAFIRNVNRSLKQYKYTGVGLFQWSRHRAASLINAFRSGYCGASLNEACFQFVKELLNQKQASYFGPGASPKDKIGIYASQVRIKNVILSANLFLKENPSIGLLGALVRGLQQSFAVGSFANASISKRLEYSHNLLPKAIEYVS